MSPLPGSHRNRARPLAWPRRASLPRQVPPGRLLAVAVLSIMICAGCSGPPPPHPVVSTASATTSSIACARQYLAWRDGPVRQATRQLASQAHAARIATRAPAFGTLRTALRRLVPTALALAAQPMPRCADTKGIYAELVLAVYKAGSAARSAKRLPALLRAAAQLARSMKIERQLTAEVVSELGARQCPARDRAPAWPPC